MSNNLRATVLYLALIICATLVIFRFVGCTEEYNAQEQQRPHHTVQCDG